MPKIPTYETQTAPQGVSQFRGLSVEDVSVGQGVRQLGAGVQDFSESLYKIKETNEKSDVAVEISKKEMELSQRLSQQQQSGVYDPELVDKFMRDADDELSALGENFSTSGGKNYFNQERQRLRNSLMSSAIKTQAATAKAKRKRDFEVYVNNNSNRVLADPDSFEPKLNDARNYLAALGVAPEDMPEQEKMLGKAFAEAAVKGRIQSGRFDFARGEITGGKYKDFFEGKETDRLLKDVDAAEKAKAAEAEFAKKKAEDAKKEAGERLFTSAVSLALSDDPLKAMELVKKSNAIDGEQKEKFIEKLGDMYKNVTQDDPFVYEALNRRAVEGKLTTEDLLKMEGKGVGREGVRKLNEVIEARQTTPLAKDSFKRFHSLESVYKRTAGGRGIFGFANEAGAALAAQYIDRDRKRLQNALRNGATEEEIDKLFSPSNKEGFYESIERLKAELAQAAAAPPRAVRPLNAQEQKEVDEDLKEIDNRMGK